MVKNIRRHWLSPRQTGFQQLRIRMPGKTRRSDLKSGYRNPTSKLMKNDSTCFRIFRDTSFPTYLIRGFAQFRGIKPYFLMDHQETKSTSKTARINSPIQFHFGMNFPLVGLDTLNWEFFPGHILHRKLFGINASQVLGWSWFGRGRYPMAHPFLQRTEQGECRKSYFQTFDLSSISPEKTQYLYLRLSFWQLGVEAELPDENDEPNPWSFLNEDGIVKSVESMAGVLLDRQIFSRKKLSPVAPSFNIQVLSFALYHPRKDFQGLLNRFSGYIDMCFWNTGKNKYKDLNFQQIESFTRRNNLRLGFRCLSRELFDYRWLSYGPPFPMEIS